MIVCSGYPLDGVNHEEAVKGGVMNKEFMLNQVGKRLQSVVNSGDASMTESTGAA